MSDVIIPLTHTKIQELSHVAAQADTRYVLAKQTGDSPARIRKKRVDDDLYLAFDDSQEILVLEDYYLYDNVSLVGITDTGSYAPYALDNPLSDGSQLYHLVTDTSAKPWMTPTASGFAKAGTIMGGIVSGVAIARNNRSDDTASIQDVESVPAAASAIPNTIGVPDPLPTTPNVDVPEPVTHVNQDPTDISLSATDVAEGKEGIVIGKVSTTDADGDTHTYTVSDDRFEIVGDELKLIAKIRSHGFGRCGVTFFLDDDRNVIDDDRNVIFVEFV